MALRVDVDHLLSTNSTPSQEQRNNLQNSILQLEEAILNTDEDISVINEQILAMQAKILVLQTKRSQLVRQRRCYSSILSPVRCLPIEIFGKIFAYATCDRPRHVLNLSAVCQLWRDAALSTPILWTTLELGRHTTRRNLDNHIDSWIERAHSYPLSLVIKKPEEYLVYPSDRFYDLVNSVRTLIAKHQWKSISLNSEDSSILSILNDVELSNLEMLESFTLALNHYSTTYSDPPDALRYAPKLKTLSLCINYRVAFDVLPFPWRQLTSLTITFWDPNASYIGLDFLRACVNLEEFIIDGHCDGGSELSDESITLNYLRKLHTRCLQNTFLLFLITPSIQDFIVEPSRVSYFHYNNVLNDYFKKNCSTLLKLSITPSDDLILESIPNLRSLVKLKLYDDGTPGESKKIHNILSSLVVNPEMEPSAIPLPRLEALEVICRATEDNQRMFVKVINSRWWSDQEENTRQQQGQRSLSRIKRSVLMDVHPELNVFCRDDVDVLRAQGMSIDYLTPSQDPFEYMHKLDF